MNIRKRGNQIELLSSLCHILACIIGMSADMVSEQVLSDGGSRPASVKVTSIEGSAVVIVPERLTGESYLDWSQSMLLALDCRDRLDFIYNDLPPSDDAISRRRWKSDNAIVASWLLNSMLPTV